SSVKVNEAVPVLPAALVSLATTVWVPSASPAGVNVHSPEAFAVAVTATALPSTVKCTTAFGSAEPVNASLGGILSVDDVPVSLTNLAVTLGVAATARGFP